ncbi:unnamed protein product [Linum trigynum]|uniref:Uncharacterized protein n=1 Tax=Linum trigynum TaxID=586398 RepID=A0AAV2FWD0_9ROSI
MEKTTAKFAFLVLLLVFAVGGEKNRVEGANEDTLPCKSFCVPPNCHCSEGSCFCNGVQHSLVAGHLIPTPLENEKRN